MTTKMIDPNNPSKFLVGEDGKFVDEPQTKQGPHRSSTSQKLAAKHIADRETANAVPETHPVNSELIGADPTPDGLGPWEGGSVRNAGVVSLKSRPTSLGDHKNEHGTNPHLGPKPITHRQDQDFCEIHTDANGDFFLYNVKTDTWDIPTDAHTVPFYEDENGKTWAYNYKTGAWDVPVETEMPEPMLAMSDAAARLEDSSLAVWDEEKHMYVTAEEHGDVIAEAVSDPPTA